MTKKEATFYIPGKGVERVDDDLCCPWSPDRRDSDGFFYPAYEALDYCEFLNCWLNMHDGGIDDDL